jgi:hypothetical protein
MSKKKKEKKRKKKKQKGERHIGIRKWVEVMTRQRQKEHGKSNADSPSGAVKHLLVKLSAPQRLHVLPLILLRELRSLCFWEHNACAPLANLVKDSNDGLEEPDVEHWEL